MARQKKQVKVLPTIWEVSDELWDIVQSILDELDPPAETGRPRTGQRAALNGIIYRMRSGVQWNQLPRRFGSSSSTTGIATVLRPSNLKARTLRVTPNPRASGSVPS